MSSKSGTCMVSSCKNSSGGGNQAVKYFSIPTDLRRRQEWIERCSLKNKFVPKKGKVCSDHFVKDDFEDWLKAELMNYPPKVLKKTGKNNNEQGPEIFFFTMLPYFLFLCYYVITLEFLVPLRK